MAFVHQELQRNGQMQGWHWLHVRAIQMGFVVTGDITTDNQINGFSRLIEWMEAILFFICRYHPSSSSSIIIFVRTMVLIRCHRNIAKYCSHTKNK